MMTILLTRRSMLFYLALASCIASIFAISQSLNVDNDFSQRSVNIGEEVDLLEEPNLAVIRRLVAAFGLEERGEVQEQVASMNEDGLSGADFEKDPPSFLAVIQRNNKIAALCRSEDIVFVWVLGEEINGFKMVAISHSEITYQNETDDIVSVRIIS